MTLLSFVCIHSHKCSQKSPHQERDGFLLEYIIILPDCVCVCVCVGETARIPVWKRVMEDDNR